tara:strand:+ start:5323 stop:5694 length:372 start_codon:yes stop_codon:yes gene_type:complete
MRLKGKRKVSRKVVIVRGLVLSASIFSILLFIGLTFAFSEFKTTPKVIDQINVNDFYSQDSCRCLEREKLDCFLDGFEYNETRGFCVNLEKKQITNPIPSCSMYECSGRIYSYDVNAKVWGEE